MDKEKRYRMKLKEEGIVIIAIQVPEEKVSYFKEMAKRAVDKYRDQQREERIED